MAPYLCSETCKPLILYEQRPSHLGHNLVFSFATVFSFIYMCVLNL